MSQKVQYLDVRINYTELGAQMYLWRKENELTQAECDELMGLSRHGTTWGRMERCRHGSEPEADLFMSNFIKIINIMHHEDSAEVLMRYFELV